MVGIRQFREAAETAGRTVSGAMVIASVALALSVVALILAVRR